jgi:HAD superfamily hydrolase (TIGR01509 family)
MSLPRRPRALAFDLDGTLIDSEALVRDAHLAAARTLGVSMSDAQFLGLVGRHREDNDKTLLGYYGPDFPLQRFIEATRAHVGDRAAPLKPGALELIGAAAEAGAPLGLVTNSRRPWVERHFAAHGLGARFQSVVTRDDCVNGKPDPEPYLNSARALGFAPRDVLAIEDSPAGVAAAHGAGLMVVVVPDLIAPDEPTRARALVRQALRDVIPFIVNS